MDTLFRRLFAYDRRWVYALLNHFVYPRAYADWIHWGKSFIYDSTLNSYNENAGIIDNSDKYLGYAGFF